MNQAKQERQLAAHVVNMELEHALETMPWPCLLGGDQSFCAVG